MTKHPGPLLKHNKPDMKEYIKYLAALGQGNPDGLKPKLLRKPQAPRAFPNKSPEADWRDVALKYLRKRGVKVKRIENSIKGKEGHSVPDHMFTYRANRICGLIEWKSLTGQLTKGPNSQQELKEDWEYCRGIHIVSRPGDYSAFDVIFEGEPPIDWGFLEENKD